ncbi:unnamed protein product [Ixodes hexagonus]
MSTPCSNSGGSVTDNVAMSTDGTNLKLDPGADTAPGSPPGRRSSSPEESCAICLGKPENKSFTDSCFHTFCFSCLLEWSKVKAECPLCKQRFKSIVHNVRSFEDYDQYFVSNNTNSNNGGNSAAANAAAAATSVVAFNALLVASRYAYMPIMTRGRRQQQTPHLLGWPMAFANRRVVARRRRTTPRTVPLLTSSTERRSLYDLNLWVRLDGRRRAQVPPSRYRDNHALTHRLIPWLNRELIALLGNGAESQVAFVMELVLALVTRYAVCSPEFVEHVRPFFGDRTPHFVHEFHAFAASSHDMVTYDRSATYETMAAAVQRRSPAAPFLRLFAESDGGAEPVGDPSQPGPSGLQRGAVVEVLESESDESDCVVLDVVRQREPVVIELSSGDEDERTVAASATVATSSAATTTAAVAAPSAPPRRKKPSQKRRRSWQRVYMSDSDSSSEDEITVRVSAARRTQLPPGRMVTAVSHDGNLKLRIRGFVGNCFGRDSGRAEAEEGAGPGTAEEPCSSRQALERAARNKRAQQRRLRQRESSDEE